MCIFLTPREQKNITYVFNFHRDQFPAHRSEIWNLLYGIHYAPKTKKPQESSDFYFVEFMAMAGLVTVS